MPQTISYAVHAAPPEPPPGFFELLCRAFDEPPYADVAAKMARRLESWPAFAEVPGFRVVTAHDADQLVGACFGWDSVVNTAHTPALFAGLYERLRAKPWAGRLVGVEVVELAVDPGTRGGGVGAALVGLLVGEGPGWLLADRSAPAYDWYRRRGWEVLGPVAEGDAYDVLVRPRSPSPNP